MPIRPLVAVAALSLAVLGALPAAGAGSAPPADAHAVDHADDHGHAEAAAAPALRVFDTDDMQDCLQLTPQRYAVAGVTDSGKRIALDVRVLLDLKSTLGVATALRDASTPEQAAAAQQQFDALVAANRPLVSPGSVSYGPLSVDYALTFDLFVPFNADGTPRSRTTTASKDAQTLINLGKAQYGGKRPAGIDIVYVLTDQDISAPGVGSAVAGMADCIGGVAWPDRAFGVGEIFPGIKIGPTEFYRQGTAKVMAHEIGHLMGAHHHYQSCGPHAAGEALASGVGACSLMTNFVDFTTFEFSVLSGAVVRAHATGFADQP